jgi:hypothetical protein
MVAPISCFYTGELVGLHRVKGNASGWLRWLLEQGGIILAHLNHRDNRCALELPFDYSPPIQVFLQFDSI